MDPIIQHNYTPSYPNYFHGTPVPTTFPTSPQLSQPLSSILSLPPLDLTPPSQNTSESDISDDFLEINYDDTDDEFGIPLEWPPSRPW